MQTPTNLKRKLPQAKRLEAFPCTSIISCTFAVYSLHFPLQFLEGAVCRRERTPEVRSGTVEISGSIDTQILHYDQTSEHTASVLK